MKIESFQIEKEKTSFFGLERINLSKLGNVVIIAGKNGSGKSRFLNLLEMHINDMIRLEIDNPDLDNKIQDKKDKIADFKKQQGEKNKIILASVNEIQIKELKRQIEALNGAIFANEQAILKRIGIQETIKSTVIIGRSSVLKYVPTSLDLIDSNTLNRSQLQEYAQYASSPNIKNMHLATLAKIQEVQTKWFNATHQLLEIPIENKEKAISDYTRLKESIKLFLGADLGVDFTSGLATIFDKLLGEVNFSQGQKVLLQFCLALYSQDMALSEMILLLDEPENHLHPAALNYVLDKLQAVVTNGQIWIATHSVNLLAHLQQETLLYMEDGAISYAGNDTMKVLEGLLGDEEERERLSTFLSLPFIVSGTQFAYESLMGAAVVMTGAADPQMKQIKEALKTSRSKMGGSEKMKMLDYGAGKGRLVAAMHELAVAEGEVLESWLDYVAYDPGLGDVNECRNNILKAYDSSNQRQYDNISLLREEQMDNSFDLIILTNVFHEIDPNIWTVVIGDIARLLKNTGRLIIVEDQRLPHGEQAHAYGFILLDTLEFIKLFSITNENKQNKEYEYHSEQEGRLKAHFFSKLLLSNVSNTTRSQALKELAYNAKKKIEEVRATPATLKNGRLHALWVQQFANASLALEKLG